MFSASFASIFWLKKRGLMPGLTLSNEFISRDEALHTKHAIELYHILYPFSVDSDTIRDIVVSACELEKSFVDDALPVRLIGMDVDSMKRYVEFVSDYLLVQFNQPKHYNTTNPFGFMEMISMQGSSITNFFESRSSQYSRAGVWMAKEDETFDVVDEF